MTRTEPPPVDESKRWWGLRLRVLIPYWILQAALFITLFVAIAVSPQPNLQEYVTSFAYGVGEFVLFRDEASLFVWGVAGAVTLAQFLFLLPVRRPQQVASGKRLLVSVAVAGLAGALLFTGLLMGALELIELLSSTEADEKAWQWVFFGGLGLGWIVATPLLWQFSRAGRVHTRLSRIASLLFVGTIVEVVAIIPIDVMVRRRTDCYCGEGTFGSLVFCCGVGMFIFGPAVWLPLLARRRKRWYSHRCEVCGYDMRGLEQAPRCPECGAGWKAEATGQLDRAPQSMS